MNPFFHQIALMARRGKGTTPAPSRLRSEQARALRVEFRHGVGDMALVLFGAAVAAAGLRSFLLPVHFLDGGVTGISLMLVRFTDVPVSVWVVLLNLPFLVMARFTVGRGFALKSLLGIVALGACVYALPYPVVTKEPILVASFGGLFLGVGIGLAIRGGAILDGTEVLAIALSKKSSLSVGSFVFLINVLIFAVAAYLTSAEVALFAVLTYLATAKTVDYIVDGVEEYVGITIVSTSSEAVRAFIIERLGRGCTIYHGASGYRADATAQTQLEIVYTVLTRLELARFRTELDKVDPDAFVVMTAVKDASGGVIKKRALQRLHEEG